ncbi:MAG: hypothetical protein H0U22_17160, partial [Geodermatophilaceae bacterium]|nr:hypothetical protein [Geodermatophilaceae bacterium]
MSTDASGITQEGPPRATAKKSEGVLARTDIPTLTHPHRHHQPDRVLTPDGATPPPRGHPRWRLTSAALREAAALAVANEFKLPYYAGSSMVVRLGSHNAHQFLNVCGDLFAEMLVDVSLGRPPHLNVTRQHRVLHNASERLWESIPRTVPNGRDVQALVREIVAIAQEENAKPRMPYPPGVTGTALLMAERKTLLDPEYRAKNPGAERLFAALASAVAYNILNADLDYSVKN